MGQEIKSHGFTDADFTEFRKRLKRETETLRTWLTDGRFADQTYEFGFELELWIIDEAMRPFPAVSELLEEARNPDMVPELAAFNLELNGPPVARRQSTLVELYRNVDRVWREARDLARGLGRELAMIGTLPTLRPVDLSSGNMSPMERYRALNEQVFRLRENEPIHVNIKGRDRLEMNLGNVMLESTTTSFQLHLKVPIDKSPRAFNAAKMLSAPMVAISANAPFLFGRSLWDESRIPVFEQAINVGASDLTRRVTFGIRYIHTDIMECFEANEARYPIMLPALMDPDPERVPHVQLHNGTIWRWNRPLIGYKNGVPHIRIEHRVIPSGPTVLDSVANAALFFGCMRALIDEPDLESRLPFETARDNFYAAARTSLESEIVWLDGETYRAKDLIEQRLVPLAADGLQSWEIDDADSLLDIIRTRAATGQNGARWQRDALARCRDDNAALMRCYLDNQNSGTPVHTWSLP